MERHLFLTGQTELHGSLVALNSMQARLRGQKATGLIEVKVGTSRQIVIVYANGVQVGTYLLENDKSRSFNLTELSVLWGGAPFSVSSVTLPDRAGRAVWLILESRLHERAEVNNEQDWNQLLARWKQEGFNGAAELTSKTVQGFIVLQMGQVVETETVFFSGNGFESAPPPNVGVYGAWQVATYAASPLSGAWKCLNLRESAIRWASRALDRYREIAGYKFLQVTSREIKEIIRPWEWKIEIANASITDDHFFAGLEAAAHAYRALLMGLGTQMSFVVGSALTQRILNEVYEDLEADQRSALGAHRLIPAAFSF
ncbi:MAG TPA: hypothetical protein PKV01_12735 [Anaerolineales bacterium]|nr:hypothetical protein [Anaerolineales bacterium]